jgi:hypothetical protein
MCYMPGASLIGIHYGLWGHYVIQQVLVLLELQLVCVVLAFVGRLKDVAQFFKTSFQARSGLHGGGSMVRA